MKKTFYEMMEMMDGDANNSNGELKNYMFFSNLKIIKNKAEELLAMDQAKIDEMLENGHDWASDHISTSRDDVEEVYNWIKSNIDN
jgi:hypothetical protein